MSIAKSLVTYCEQGIESLRNELPRSNNELAAERIVEMMAAAMALDNAAFSEFIALVIETRKSIREIES